MRDEDRLEVKVLHLERRLAASELQGRRLVRRVTATNVVAAVTALAFAGAGGAYAVTMAAANSVNSASIVDGSIASPDLKNNAVPGGKILDNSIGSADIADNSVTSADIKDHTITGFDVLDDAISGSKITDGELAGVDLSDETIGGAKIIDDSLTGDDIDESTLAIKKTYFARVFSGGELASGSDAVSSKRSSTGSYTVTFGFEVNRCAAFATGAYVPILNGETAVSSSSSDVVPYTATPPTGNAVGVSLVKGDTDTLIDSSFVLLLVCP